MVNETGTKACPWCAETILTAAKKCKHCGEFLEGGQVAPVGARSVPMTNPVASGKVATPSLRCDHCSFTAESARSLYLHKANEHGVTETRPSANRTGYGRQKLSQVGKKAETGQLTCPKCGGTQFVAKRSNTGKLVGFTTLGVGGLLAPKSQVKCVTCGTMFKRG